MDSVRKLLDTPSYNINFHHVQYFEVKLNLCRKGNK